MNEEPGYMAHPNGRSSMSNMAYTLWSTVRSSASASGLDDSSLPPCPLHAGARWTSERKTTAWLVQGSSPCVGTARQLHSAQPLRLECVSRAHRPLLVVTALGEGVRERWPRKHALLRPRVLLRGRCLIA